MYMSFSRDFLLRVSEAISFASRTLAHVETSLDVSKLSLLRSASPDFEASNFGASPHSAITMVAAVGLAVDLNLA
jgi:hypothetical protein